MIEADGRRCSPERARTMTVVRCCCLLKHGFLQLPLWREPNKPVFPVGSVTASRVSLCRGFALYVPWWCLIANVSISSAVFAVCWLQVTDSAVSFWSISSLWNCFANITVKLLPTAAEWLEWFSECTRIHNLLFAHDTIMMCAILERDSTFATWPTNPVATLQSHLHNCISMEISIKFTDKVQRELDFFFYFPTAETPRKAMVDIVEAV